jgi:hypothetical protein
MSNARFGLRVRSGSVGSIIQGLTVRELLLDVFPGATFAYSLRLLRQGYNGFCVRVRRSSDNTEQDIGFINSVLDSTSLLSFVGASDGYISIWYDQSGNNYNQIQNSLSSQPQLVNSGNILNLNNKPFIFTDGTNDFLSTANPIPTYNNATMIIVGAQILPEAAYGRFIDNNFTTGFWFGRNNGTQAVNGGFLQPNSPYGVVFSLSDGTQFTLFSHRSGAVTTSIINNFISGTITTNSNTSTSSIVRIGRSDVGDWGRKYHQEYIFYPTNLSTLRNQINENVNSFYNIYI